MWRGRTGRPHEESSGSGFRRHRADLAETDIGTDEVIIVAVSIIRMAVTTAGARSATPSGSPVEEGASGRGHRESTDESTHGVGDDIGSAARAPGEEESLDDLDE